ncbi:hypothetical protein D8I24_4388 [Cupriavidus necator H850]|nr:hypothetical protein D8I24_4388 [Cupriavidus necator H850]
MSPADYESAALTKHELEAQLEGESRRQVRTPQLSTASCHQSAGWRHRVTSRSNDHADASGDATAGTTFFAEARFFGMDFTAAAFGDAFAATLPLVPGAAFFAAAFVAKALLAVAFLAPAAFAFFAASLSFAACFSKLAAAFAASTAWAASCLETVSKRRLSAPEDVPADERAAEFEERFVNVGSTFEANAKTTKVVTAPTRIPTWSTGRTSVCRS